MEGGYPLMSYGYNFSGPPDSILTNQNLGKHVSALWRAANSSSSVRPYNNTYPSSSHTLFNNWILPPGASTGRISQQPQHQQQQQPHQQQQQQQQQQSQPHQQQQQLPQPQVPPPIPALATIKIEPGLIKTECNGISTEKWVVSKMRFSWDNSPVASYNSSTKMFRCVVCNTTGFSLRIAEHYLGTHANAKVFQCPHCPYSSSWSRCVRMHMGKTHGLHHVPDSLWKGQPLLDEILTILNQLKTSVEGTDRDKCPEGLECSDKRYMCPKCPYATDRRDLFSRHENIHREDKPFHCYICLKMFNRADHVKKHFFRIHKEQPYDLALIRRYPPKNASSGSGGSSQHLNGYSWYHCKSSGKLSSGATAHNTTTSSGETNLASGKKKPFKAFMCTYCPWRGVDSWCLRRHLNTHIKPFPCPLCDYKAARSERLSTHILKVHNKHACNKCTFVTEVEKNLEHHLKERQSDVSLPSTYAGTERILSCSMCTETFESRSDLETHSILSHDQKLVECSLGHCDFRTTDLSILEKHQQDKHCVSGGEVIEVEEDEEEDVMKCEYCCRRCGCQFFDALSLQNHVEIWHRGIAPVYPYCCSLCGFACRHQSKMIEHVRVHSGQVLQCKAGDGCNFDTPFDAALGDHVAREHGDEDSIARCPHCGSPCSTESAFAVHYRECHHPAACPLCHFVKLKFFSTERPPSKNNDTSPSSPCSDVSDSPNGSRRSRKQPRPRKVVVHTKLPSQTKKGRAENKTKLLLTRYREKLKEASETPLLMCRICCSRPFYYRSNSNLLLHVYWHHSKKDYTCATCRKAFKYKYQLWLHQRCHKAKKKTTPKYIL